MCSKTMTCSRWSTPASRPITVVDDYLAGFWSKVFTGIKVHCDVAVRTRRQPGRRVPQGESQTPRGRQHLAPETRRGRRLPQRRRAPLPRERQIREECRSRCRAPQTRGGGRAIQEVRQRVQPGLCADGRTGLPGIDARPERQEPGRRDRRDAGDAARPARS